MPDAAYYSEHKAEGKERLKLWRDANWVRATLNRCVSNARARAAGKRLPFEIDNSFIMALYVAQDFKCAVTGLKFRRGTTASSDFSPTIDRIDNSMGYTPTNVRIVLGCVNAFKGRMTDAEMLVVAKCLVAQCQ